jgi:hypothetical protein
MKKNVLTNIIERSTNLTSLEAAGQVTVWSDLLSLSKFAGCSKPERNDAITRIKYAIYNYEMRQWHKDVLSGIINILEINPGDAER